MLSVADVNAGIASFDQAFSDYSTSLEDLGEASWSGPSHTSFMSQANAFVGEFQGTIDKQLGDFSSAVGKYHSYKEKYERRKALESALDEEDHQSEINTLTNEMHTLETEIKGLLSDIASSKSLTANVTAVDVAPVAANLETIIQEANSVTSDKLVQTLIDYAKAIADDPKYGYTPGGYGAGGFDCGGLVWYLLNKVYGLNYNTRQGISPYMLSNQLPKYGFEKYRVGSPVDVNQLKAGDLLVNPNVDHGHVAIYIGNGQILEARWNFDSKSGDGSGQEISVNPYYSRIKDFKYNEVIRLQGWKGASKSA